MSFFVELWNSVFQPGVTPQLIVATHVSFTALLLTLSWLIYATKGNIHFIALTTIALLLWITVIWFIQELKNVKLMSNDELTKEGKAAADAAASSSATSTSVKTETSVKSRKA